MAIEINGSNPHPIQTGGTPSQPAAERGQAEVTGADKQTGRTAGRDTVSLTDTAQTLRGIEQSLEKVPVVDAQRVEAIQQAISNGTYQVDSNRIAERLMGLERQLAGVR
jgi:negative regulator of flagellin synthesis FlgM